MKWKGKKPLSLEERVARIAGAGIAGDNKVCFENLEDETLVMEDLPTRIRKVLGIVRENRRQSGMLFFVMYDIENNKVRRLVARYLLECGCLRIQKSIFLGNLTAESCNRIKADLAQVQSYYENEDSILIVPVSMDHFKAMTVIGQNIDFDVVTRDKSTLFF